MNRNSVFSKNEYARREVNNEESLLLEQCFCDFGWECLKKESLGGGKTQLYFRRERQEGAKKANKLNALQKDCEKLIRDVERKRKLVCDDPHDMPVVAIVDQDMGSSMPKVLPASTGMDALTPANRCSTTKAAWDMPDMFHS